jgi:large subunit ribosomal protein L24
MRKFKANDEIVVIAGKNIGMTGKVISFNTKNNKILVDGINEVQRAVKPSQGNPAGGFIKKNLPIDASNVSHYNKTTKKAEKIKFVNSKAGTKVRVLKKSKSEVK